MSRLLQRRLAPLLILLLPITAWAEGYPVLELVGKTPQQIAVLLGQADTCSEANKGLTCEYRGSTVEVIFIDGRADWFSFAGLPEIEFDYHALQYIGLAVVPPFVHTPTRMHWQHHHGLEVVSVYGNGKNVAMIKVRAYTPQ
jgi:hypothetical protein